MLKQLTFAIIAFTMAGVMAVATVYAQTSTPTPTPTATPTQQQEDDNDDDTPSGAPQTGYGGMNQ